MVGTRPRGRDLRGKRLGVGPLGRDPKPMIPMIQTDLRRYEHTDTQQTESYSTSKEAPSEGTAIESGALENNSVCLSADEAAVLRYVRDNGATTREELCYRSRLTVDHVNEILDSLERHELIDVTSGDTVVQIRPGSA